MLVVVLDGGILMCPKQPVLDRIKAAGACGRFLLTLIGFLVTSRRDHATGDSQYLVDCMVDLLEVDVTLLQLQQGSLNHSERWQQFRRSYQSTQIF